MSDSKRPRSSTIVWSLVWALAILAAAYLFKGSPALYWIESVLFVGGLTLVILPSKRADCLR